MLCKIQICLGQIRSNAKTKGSPIKSSLPANLRFEHCHIWKRSELRVNEESLILNISLYN